MEIPKNHQTIMPYLLLNGASKFREFAKTVFNAQDITNMLAEDGKTYRHSELKIGESTIMYSDATDAWQEQTAALFVYVDDADATFKKAIDAGAEEVMPLKTEDYGRTGGVKDPLGNIWWITCSL